jgi:hypothetical protein
MGEQPSIHADVRFDALRNAIYHTERRFFFDIINKLINFTVIALGASVAGKAAAQLHFPELWLELGVVAVATAQLVFDFGSRARTHEFLQKRYYELLGEMETADSDAKRKHWGERLMTLAADEPMAMRALDALAYNKAVDATIDDPQQVAERRLHVPWLHRRLRHFIAFQGAKYLPESMHLGIASK